MKDVAVVMQARFRESVPDSPTVSTGKVNELRANERVSMCVDGNALVVRWKGHEGLPLFIPIENVCYVRPGNTESKPPPTLPVRR